MLLLRTAVANAHLAQDLAELAATLRVGAKEPVEKGFRVDHPFQIGA